MPGGRTRRAVTPRMPFEHGAVRCSTFRSGNSLARLRVAVLCLKVLNLLLAFLPVHSVFLGESERLNKHCAPKSESRVARRRERGSRRYDRGWRSPKPGYKNFPGKKSERFPAVSGH